MKTSTILGGILAVQLLLAAGIGWGRYMARDDTQPQPLLDFAVSQVDRIEIDDGSNHAILAKNGDNWTLPDLQALAADRSRVTGLLDNLSNLKTGWPVATTQSSIKRLEVGDDKYQRKLSLMAGGKVLGEYYFGTSPGLRQTHARRAGEDQVFALAVNNYDLPAQGNDWLDKTLLSLSEVTRISGPDYALMKEEDNWRFDHVDTGETLDQAKVNDVVSALKNLRVLRVAEALPDTDPVSITVGDMERNWTYNFYDEKDKYFIKRDDMDAGFTISKSSFDRIAGVARDALLTAPPEESGENADGKAAAA